MDCLHYESQPVNAGMEIIDVWIVKTPAGTVRHGAKCHNVFDDATQNYRDTLKFISHVVCF
jgi:hypothetical protein